MPTFEANGGGAADDRTKFTDSGADFQAYMAGWLLQPDVELPSYLEIVEVDESSGNWVRVKGDADTLATSGSTYRLHAPPGVDRATGALITDMEESGSHWLWAGYEYVPPMVGFHNPEGQDPGTYGAQSGGNKLGSYHCWNRVYEPATGRWTTPDPAMSPWWNLLEYAHDRPTSNIDTTGLDCTLTIVASEAADSSVREDIIAGFGTRCLATSAAGFKECFDEWKKDNPDCECLEAVTIIGESGSDFGGGEGFDKITTESLIAMREMMCDEAQMEYRSCDGYANGWFWTLVYELQKGHSSITGTGYSGKCYPSGRYISGRKISTEVNFPDGTFHPKGRDEAGLALAGFVQCTARCLDTYYEALPMYPSAEEHQNESDKYWECVSQCRKNNIRGFWRFLFED